MIAITYDSLNLQSGTIVVSDLEHENVNQKRLNIQKFADREGGKLIRPDFDVKIIRISGHIKGTSQSNLESTIDNLKKTLNGGVKNLDIEYSGGTRRYLAECSKMLFPRKFWTIDYMEFDLEFTVMDPPLGMSIDTSTIQDPSNTNTFASTLTGEHDGYADYGGTFRPHPIIKITFTSANGIRRVVFRNTDGNGYVSATEIRGHKFYDGDILIIDTREGTVQVNGEDVDFTLGFPNFTLNGNHYLLKVIGKAYNVDLKFIYYKLWL